MIELSLSQKWAALKIGFWWARAERRAKRWAEERLAPADTPYPGSLRTLFHAEVHDYLPARFFYPLLRSLDYEVTGGPEEFHVYARLQDV
jgi:hypothetical protein